MRTPNTLDILTNHGVKPSVQRLAVMDYLVENHTHPTADEIYSALHKQMPTLSKTTVYNTLKLLTEQGAAIQLTIDERNVCFDADVSPHAHFLCTCCGKVYDMSLTDPRTGRPCGAARRIQNHSNGPLLQRFVQQMYCSGD